jgi:hypothetical protein
MLKSTEEPTARTLVFTAVPLDVLIAIGPAVACEEEVVPQPATTAARAVMHRA